MLLLLLCLLPINHDAHAAGSYARFYGDLQGLHAGEIAALAQDQEGFIWIGSQGGLLRFDGDQFVRFAASQIPHGVKGLWWHTGTGLLIQTERHHAFIERAGRISVFSGPDKQPITDLRSAVFDDRGQLWTILGSNLWHRDNSSHWYKVSANQFHHEQPFRLSKLAHGIALITNQGAWHLDARGHARLLLHKPELFAAAGGGDHPLWLVTHGDGYLWRQEQGHFVAVTKVGGRVLDMRYRGNTLWVSADRFLLAVRPDNSMFTLDINHGLPSGGPLLVDHEGSLWVGTFVGLQQYPEPETRHWTELDGLPWQHTFDVAAADGQIWVNTWGGTVRFDTHDVIPHMIRMSGAAGVLCADREGRMWQVVNKYLSYWKNGHYARSKASDYPIHNLEACTTATDGGMWLTTDKGVFHVDSQSGDLHRVFIPGVTSIGAYANLVWQQDADTLWAMTSNKLCNYSIIMLRAQLHSCLKEQFESGFFHVVKITRDHFWISTYAGLFSFDGHDVHLLAGNQSLPGKRFRTIKPALSGGYWAVGPDVLERIMPCSDCAAGFKVLETIGIWQGVPADSALDVVELASGDLWIAGNRGVYHVPAKARLGPQTTPPLVLVNVNVDGKNRKLDSPLPVQPGKQQINISFAALTFRDRSLLRYRFRNNSHGHWSATTRNPELQFIQPEHGAYYVQAEASLDGVHWSQPVSYRFSVAPHWYETLWARIVLILLICACMALIIRLWIEYRLRMERQRIRIAMDLHDEIGSTLGSIGMLVGAITAGGASVSEQRHLLNRVTDTVARLGSALRTVVWSMRQPTVDMSQMLTEIGDQAKHLLPGDSPRISVRSAGTLMDVYVNSVVRRHVLMIALEAMHNVARHAHADKVMLKLSRLDDSNWRMEVHDDGVGYDLHAVYSGSGLENMRRRARLIHAALAVYSEPGSGTSITLDFKPEP